MEHLVQVDRIATGGAGVATLADGRISFVEGALPGEKVRARILTEHKRHTTARVIEVVEASPDRVAAPCEHLARGCGGCDWQYVAPEAASEFRRAIVLDCLARIGRLDDCDVRVGPSLAVEGYRTIMRAAVTEGRAGFRIGGTHESIAIGSCLTAHPLAEELLQEGRYGPASEVAIKVGVESGERLVMVDRTPADVQVPDDVLVAHKQMSVAEMPHIHEVVAGQRFRISAPSFFQCRPDGAAVLVDLVTSALAPTLGADGGKLLDAYAGVGLFGATVGQGRQVVAVESNPWSARDAKSNLADDALVVQSTVEQWQPQEVDAVVADPSRKGLGAKGVAALAATKAEGIALVSCDPASLGRDAGLLAKAGYVLEWTTTVDLFGHTSHVEAVSSFRLG